MGWYPVNKMTLVRDSDTREIIVSWNDSMLGDREKRFTWEEQEKALDLAKKEFNSLCM
jgi:hypothetical protein